MKIQTRKHVERVDGKVETCSKNVVQPIETQKSVRSVRAPDFTLMLEAALQQRLPRSVTLWPGWRGREISGVDANQEVMRQFQRMTDDGPLGLAAADILLELWRAWQEG